MYIYICIYIYIYIYVWGGGHVGQHWTEQPDRLAALPACMPACTLNPKPACLNLTPACMPACLCLHCCLQGADAAAEAK